MSDRTDVGRYVWISVEIAHRGDIEVTRGIRELGSEINMSLLWSLMSLIVIYLLMC